MQLLLFFYSKNMNEHRSITFYIFITIAIVNFTSALPQWYNGTDGRQYLIEGEQKYNWFQAFHECGRRNLQLVEIENQQKNEVLIAILKPIFGNSHNLWIGAIDEYNRVKSFQRPFYWHSSGKQMTFSYWSNNNPDNDIGDEHCVHMWERKANYKWNDHHCDWPRLGYICEDHHLSSKVLGEKVQEITNLADTLLEEYYVQQESQIESLRNALNRMENDELQLKADLNTLQIKLQSDINSLLSESNLESNISKLMAQYKVEVNLKVDERNLALIKTNLELSGAVEILTKKFGKKLKAAKTEYKNILEK
ncbi:lectin subunit alpha-like [Musca autumnalis]|uniref:lectin subunit alpha-like n=1 Tax=Musca autumnalis TaxID=221902 RepID=UPI003CF0B1CF